MEYSLANWIFAYPTVLNKSILSPGGGVGSWFSVEAFAELWFKSRHFIIVFIFNVNTLMWCFMGKHSRLLWIKYCFSFKNFRISGAKKSTWKVITMVLLDVKNKSSVPSTVHDNHFHSRAISISIPVAAFCQGKSNIRAASHAHLAGADSWCQRIPLSLR